MTEIEKLYDNAGIEPLCQIPDGYCGVKNVYEDFTAEKQLKLLEEITKLYRITITHSMDAYYIKARSKNGNKFRVNHYFDEGLASLINDLWQDLTEQEQERIRDILRR